MAISLNQITKVIYVPKADTTLISGEIRSLDMEEFHDTLRTLEALPINDVFEVTHNHTRQGTLGGTTYPRRLEILAPWNVEFEDGQWRVRLLGGDSNIEDRQVVNQVSVSTFNSAGNSVTNVGSGLSAGEQAELTDLWEAHYHRRKLDKTALTETLYQVDKVTPKVVFDTNADVATEGLTELTPQ